MGTKALHLMLHRTMRIRYLSPSLTFLGSFGCYAESAFCRYVEINNYDYVHLMTCKVFGGSWRVAQAVSVSFPFHRAATRSTSLHFCERNV